MFEWLWINTEYKEKVCDIYTSFVLCDACISSLGEKHHDLFKGSKLKRLNCERGTLLYWRDPIFTLFRIDTFTRPISDGVNALAWAAGLFYLLRPVCPSLSVLRVPSSLFKVNCREGWINKEKVPLLFQHISLHYFLAVLLLLGPQHPCRALWEKASSVGACGKGRGLTHQVWQNQWSGAQMGSPGIRLASRQKMRRKFRSLGWPRVQNRVPSVH